MHPLKLLPGYAYGVQHSDFLLLLMREEEAQCCCTLGRLGRV